MNPNLNQHIKIYTQGYWFCWNVAYYKMSSIHISTHKISLRYTFVDKPFSISTYKPLCFAAFLHSTERSHPQNPSTNIIFCIYLLTTQHCAVDQCHWVSQRYGFPRIQIVVCIIQCEKWVYWLFQWTNYIWSLWTAQAPFPIAGNRNSLSSPAQYSLGKPSAPSFY